MGAARVTAYAVLLTGALLAGGPALAAAGVATQAFPPLGLAESSGMTASALHDGVIWVVEDGGTDPWAAPVVRAFDQSGAEVGTVTLAGWNNRDTEALSMGPGPTLWVGDIGDNSASRDSVVVHTLPEPTELGATTVEPVSYRLRYPDGARDAESIMVDPVDGRLYVATKSVLGVGSLYVAPTALVAGETHDLTLVSNVPSGITDGAFTPDGGHLVLLQGLALVSAALVFDVSRPAAGAPIEISQTDELDLPQQTQPETLTVTRDGTAVLVGSEGAEEPVWSVPLPPPVRVSTPPVPEPSTSTADPEATPSASRTTGGPTRCDFDDPRSCLDSPVGWLAAAAVALAGLLLGALAVLRHSRT